MTTRAERRAATAGARTPRPTRRRSATSWASSGATSPTPSASGTPTTATPRSSASSRTALSERTGPRRMLDLGCAYGNHIFMTNARLGLDQDVQYTGVELAPRAARLRQLVRGGRARLRQLHLPGRPTSSSRSPSTTTPSTSSTSRTSSSTCPTPRPCCASSSASRGQAARSSSAPRSARPPSSPSPSASTGSAAVGSTAGYYHGKETELDEHGHPVMEVDAGHDHISEMNIDEATRRRRAGRAVRRRRRADEHHERQHLVRPPPRRPRWRAPRRERAPAPAGPLLGARRRRAVRRLRRRRPATMRGGSAERLECDRVRTQEDPQRRARLTGRAGPGPPRGQEPPDAEAS